MICVVAIVLFIACTITCSDHQNKKNRKSYTGIKSASHKNNAQVSITSSATTYQTFSSSVSTAASAQHTAAFSTTTVSTSYDQEAISVDDYDDDGEISRSEMPAFFAHNDTDKNRIPEHIKSVRALTSLIVKAPQNYAQLAILNLSNQNIAGSFDLSCFTNNLPNLQQLILDDNDITEFAEGNYKEHTILKTFSIKNNQFTALSLKSFLSIFPNTSELKICQNKGIKIDSENILRSTQCVLYCRQCDLSERDVSVLSYNALYMPTTFTEDCVTASLHVLNGLEGFVEGFGGMIVTSYVLPEPRYAGIIALGVVPIIAWARNYLITKGILSLIFPPQQRELRMSPAYTLVTSNQQRNNLYGTDKTVVW